MNLFNISVLEINSTTVSGRARVVRAPVFDWNVPHLIGNHPCLIGTCQRLIANRQCLVVTAFKQLVNSRTVGVVVQYYSRVWCCIIGEMYTTIGVE